MVKRDSIESKILSKVDNEYGKDDKSNWTYDIEERYIAGSVNEFFVVKYKIDGEWNPVAIVVKDDKLSACEKLRDSIGDAIETNEDIYLEDPFCFLYNSTKNGINWSYIDSRPFTFSGKRDIGSLMSCEDLERRIIGQRNLQVEASMAFHNGVNDIVKSGTESSSIVRELVDRYIICELNSNGSGKYQSGVYVKMYPMSGRTSVADSLSVFTLLSSWVDRVLYIKDSDYESKKSTNRIEKLIQNAEETVLSVDNSVERFRNVKNQNADFEDGIVISDIQYVSENTDELSPGFFDIIVIDSVLFEGEKYYDDPEGPMSYFSAYPIVLGVKSVYTDSHIPSIGDLGIFSPNQDGEYVGNGQNIDMIDEDNVTKVFGNNFGSEVGNFLFVVNEPNKVEQNLQDHIQDRDIRVIEGYDDIADFTEENTDSTKIYISSEILISCKTRDLGIGFVGLSDDHSVDDRVREEIFGRSCQYVRDNR